MIAHIAADLAVSEAQINLKAKTNERLGWEGREEGIAAQAIVLLLQK
jgi:2-C-methyl-D-erythritol 2,4-cyclodiphosphate synthase